MSEKPASRPRHALLLKLGLAGVVVLGLTVLLLKGVDLRGLLDRTLAWIREIGPVAFFSAMAILPSFGAPLLAFTLSAGPVFGPEMGLGMVAFWSVVSITVNLALTYWLARYAIRPLLSAVIRWMGYPVPRVSPEDYVSLAVVVRVTPGPPFFAQGYLLGLAEVPFRIYMAVSWPIIVAMSVAVIVFGDSLVHGRGKIAFLALSLLVVLSVGIQWIRRRYARRKKTVA